MRIRAYQILKDPVYLQEAQAAIQSTVEGMASSLANRRSFCLCHGLAGNAELLIIGNELPNPIPLRPIVEGIAMNGIVNYLQSANPWPCGIPEGGETPGLMLGLAGIGYFLLRVYDARSVPSILLPVNLSG
jgi:lantibiotic modifying enzyme